MNTNGHFLNTEAENNIQNELNVWYTQYVVYYTLANKMETLQFILLNKYKGQ